MQNQIENQKQAKDATTKFTAMVGAYFFGVFNDNYYKQAAMLLAVTAGLSHLQGTATILFSLPFVLFSAYGGWMADRFPKKKVIISAKILELIACTLGALGLLTSNWNAILAMIFIMGLQATIFAPALNATIPEIYPESHVTKANAILKLMTTIAILVGLATAGISLDQNLIQTTLPFGIILVSIVVVGVALLGLLCSLAIYHSPSKNPHLSFPLRGPWQSLLDIMELRKRPDLLTSVFSSTFFYSVSTLLVLTINTLGLTQFNLSQTTTSLMSVALMIGVCVGAFIAGKISSVKNWFHLLPLSAGVMSLGMFFLGMSPFFPEALRLAALFGLLIFIGIAGGILIIPVTTYVQVKPEAHEKGKIIGVVNFSDFIGIILAGEIYLLLNHFFTPSQGMLVLASFALIYCLATFQIVKRIKKYI